MQRKLSQLLLLTWKNYVLQKRHWVRTLFEIGLPIFVSLLLIWLRTKVSYMDYKEPAIYGAYPIDKLPQNLTREKMRLPFPVPCTWRMAHAPNGSAENRVMELVTQSLKEHLVKLDTGLGFATEADMLDFLTASDNSTYHSEFLGGVTFHNPFPSADQLPTNITYSIRLKASQRNFPGITTKQYTGATSRWHTDELFELISTPGPRQKEHTWGGKPGYMREGFLPLQHAIDRAFLQFQNISTDNFSVEMRRYPYPPYFDDDFILVIQIQLPFLILISFVITAITITKEVVLEKERKLKESMKIMGLSNWLHWTAWFLKYTLFLFISVAFITLLYKIPVGSHGAVINNSSPSLLLLFFFMYSLVIIAQCFAVSVVFSTANTGAVFMGLIWFFSYVPYYFIIQRYESVSRGLKMVSCVLANTGMSMGAYLIGLYEGTGEGIQWSNINRPVSEDDNFSFLDVLLMFLVDIVWYLIFMWYVEAVFPGSFGVPRKWYFPFQVSYWCGPAVRDNEERSFQEPLTPDSQRPSMSFFEPDPKGLHAGVKIQGLTKIFGKDKVAVKQLTLNMYEGQITALLGHNGAGKTTTLSMLTGLFPPTSGMALVNEYDIRTEIDGVRCSLGLCPQHDVLFDRMTVREHLYFFAKLKGCPSSRVKKEVESYINALELQDKRDAQARQLSGGMRRKLCVGIALIYDSKVVMLDEPTSGMDPSARRFTWDLLQRHRQGRTILLTTHHMDEADLLGDRIAIMAKGELQCVGTSLFLKKKYGVGYHMTIAKTPTCDVARVSALISKHVPGMQEESNVGSELSYILPEESVGQFEQLFNDLEQQRAGLGINSYGASVTTMEEVFLKVDQEESAVVAAENGLMESNGSASSLGTTNGDHIQSDRAQMVNGMTKFAVTLPDAEQGSSDTEPLVALPQRNTGRVLYLQQFRAMFQKRMYHTWRNLLVIAVQLLIPLFMTAVAVVAEKTFPAIGESPPLMVDIHTYGRTTVPYFLAGNKQELVKPLAHSYVDYLEHLKQNPIFVNNVTDANTTSMVGYLIDIGSKQLVTFNRKNLAAAVFAEEKQKIMATAFFNDQPYHTPAAALSAIDNALLRYYLKGEHVVTTVNHPLPRTFHEKANDDLESQVFTGFTIAFNMLFGMSFLASSFVLFLVKENASKAKHVQFVSGVHSLNFWLSTLLWDLINYAVPCILIVVMFAAFGIEAYAGDYRFFAILLLLLLHGWSIIPLMYLFSFLFSVPSTAFVRLTMFNIIVGIAAFMAVNILEIPSLNLQSVADALTWVFSISPSYCLGKGLSDFYENYGVLKICNKDEFSRYFCNDPDLVANNSFFRFNDNYLGFKAPGIGSELVFMAGTGALYFFLVILVEEGILRSLRYRLRDLFCGRSPMDPQVALLPETALDEDVLTEKSRILGGQSLTDVLILRDLRKVYSSSGKPPLVAVEGTSLGIPAGECFGLLGVNGAGKTTTFKMLTGDELVTDGDALVDGFNIKSNIKQVQQRIGYCPQFDALIDQLTGRETLRLYARLRGMKEAVIESKVQELLAMFSLTEYADKQTKTYSGGNKRKLSTTIALIGDPPIVFLDEPSTGMDPVTKRLLWKALCQVRNEGRCIVLTSHSMEECEALCTRLAIMVNGQIKCLGSTQHLKSRFGEGFTVLAKVSSRDGIPDMMPLKQFIETQFPGSRLKDEHQSMVHYHITNTQLTWAQVFGTMERAKPRYDIEDYSVSQTTLEQVFINFARMQREDELQS
ncbi:ATP-binding cassette sub-family A member 3-like [Acanthaster planci]|uniref:ATP-binding cassette sub-family A member 3-like n=1 Tax=Acanthaster planci TaxID=133434 RepID=A0A8B7YC95_ACAPL|nr:ATP-binding cassette sub-family A member 3-like [Acanthaster planci]XP_022089307.1 ATP-binding cassette sub-family A member 3-like [Acanthaster planci]